MIKYIKTRNSELINACSRLLRVPQNSHSQYNKLRLSISNGIAKIENHDGVGSISNEFKCETTFDGNFLVNKDLFEKVIKELPSNTDSDETVIEYHETHAKIKSESIDFECKLNIDTNLSEYPDMILPINPIRFRIDQSELKRHLKSVMYSASTEDARYFMQSVIIEKYGNSLTFVSTDGYRLAISQKEDDVIPKFRASVPIKHINTVYKILEEGSCDISISRDYILFEIGSSKISIKLIDNNEAKYQNVIPDFDKDKDIEIKLETKHMLNSIKRASKIIDKQSNGVVLIGSKVDNSILIKSRGFDGESEIIEKIIVQSLTNDFKIKVNCIFLMQTFSTIEEDISIITIKNSTTPFMINPSDQVLTKHVIGPMKVENWD